VLTGTFRCHVRRTRNPAEPLDSTPERLTPPHRTLSKDAWSKLTNNDFVGFRTQPSRYEVLAARNAKFRRANRALAGNLKLAAAQIQRLGAENARLREALEASSNITRIGRVGSR
jgi:hypothetical protein